MYLRATPRRNNDGSVVRYLQLAHNVWDPQAKRSKAQVIYNFGREEAESRAAIERLVASLSRFLAPEAGLDATAGEGFDFLESRPLGGSYALDGLWRRLGIDALLRRALKGRRIDAAAERVLFSLVANRALAPSSKLAASRWVCDEACIEGLPAVTDDACYRAMDWLLEIAPALEREVFHQVASLLNLEVDFVFFDTTSTYFCLDEADEPVPRDQRGEVLAGGQHTVRETGFRTSGHSKDHRGDLPQVVVGMAVTAEGIPVRVWSWPGSSADVALIRQVKDDLCSWALSRVVWVSDRGFASQENRRELRRGDDAYIMAEKLRGRLGRGEGRPGPCRSLPRARRQPAHQGGAHLRE